MSSHEDQLDDDSNDHKFLCNNNNNLQNYEPSHHQQYQQQHNDQYPNQHSQQHSNPSGLSKAELRKSNKPIMEKKRRARINHCLNELKTLILDAMKKDPARHTKLEKADILEMTVKHLQTMQRDRLVMAVQTDSTILHKFKAGFADCTDEVSRYITQLDGVETGVKQRLIGHLNNCIGGLQQISSFSYNNNGGGGGGINNLIGTGTNNITGGYRSSSSYTNGVAIGISGGGNVSGNTPIVQPLQDINNNSGRIQMGGVQLIPSRLPTGELALVMPNSSNLPYFPTNTFPSSVTSNKLLSHQQSTNISGSHQPTATAAATTTPLSSSAVVGVEIQKPQSVPQHLSTPNNNHNNNNNPLELSTIFPSRMSAFNSVLQKPIPTKLSVHHPNHNNNHINHLNHLNHINHHHHHHNHQQNHHNDHQHLSSSAHSPPPSPVSSISSDADSTPAMEYSQKSNCSSLETTVSGGGSVNNGNNIVHSATTPPLQTQSNLKDVFPTPPSGGSITIPIIYQPTSCSSLSSSSSSPPLTNSITTITTTTTVQQPHISSTTTSTNNNMEQLKLIKPFGVLTNTTNLQISKIENNKKRQYPFERNDEVNDGGVRIINNNDKDSIQIQARKLFKSDDNGKIITPNNCLDGDGLVKNDIIDDHNQASGDMWRPW